MAEQQLKSSQYYIHQDVEPWFRKLLVQTYGDAQLTYEDLHHFNLEHVRFIKICGSEVLMKRAVETIENIRQQTQYQLPWISENMYYIRTNLQMQSVVTKLKSKHISDYKIRSTSVFFHSWFWFKDLHVFEFYDLTKTKRRIVERVFRQIAETYKEPIVSIYDTLQFHEIHEEPIQVFMKVLGVFKGSYLKYLSVEDILALELANKDHRILWFDPIVDTDIRGHLRKRISHDEITSFLTEFKNSALLSYFIYKYRHSFQSSIIIPPIIQPNEIRKMAQLFNIDIWTDKLFVTQKSSDGNHCSVSPDLINRYLRPPVGYTIFHNFNGIIHHYEEFRNTIVLRKTRDKMSNDLNHIIRNISNFVMYQDKLQLDLHLIRVNISDLAVHLFSHFTLFHKLIFEKMLFDVSILPKLLQSDTLKISFLDCEFQSGLNMSKIPFRVPEIVFKHCNFEFEILIRILSNCVTFAVILDSCTITRAKKDIEICTKPINLSYIEFKCTTLSSELLNVLKYFGSDSIVCFNDCGITNTDIWNIYTKTNIIMSRLKILSQHQVNENIIFELYDEYYKRSGVFDLGEDDFDVPSEIVLHIEVLTSQFDWANIKLRPHRVNDHTVKVDIVKKGIVVDLYLEHNGLAEDELKYGIDCIVK